MPRAIHRCAHICLPLPPCPCPCPSISLSLSLSVYTWQFEEADSLLFIALEGFFGSLGPRHICTAEVAYTFAVLAVQQGRRNKAAYLFALAYEGLAAALGKQHQVRELRVHACVCAMYV